MWDLTFNRKRRLQASTYVRDGANIKKHMLRPDMISESAAKRGKKTKVTKASKKKATPTTEIVSE
jgi:hypothetical protein